MIKSFDFDHEKQKMFYPIALDHVNSPNIEISISCIKFLSAYFQNTNIMEE